MQSFNLKNLAAMSALGFIAVLGTSGIANAQDNRRYDDRRDDWRQERKISKQQEKIQKQRAKILQQQQDEDRNRRYTRRSDDRSNANGYYNGNANANRNYRYRLNRGGSYYNTDQRGADLLRHAVNAGYQQGFQAARNNRSSNRRGSYSNSNIYQSGNYGYQSHVDRSQYQYYFRQGFQRGYQDGSNTRYQNDYNGDYQYGSNNGGSVNILGTILNQILNLQSY